MTPENRARLIQAGADAIRDTWGHLRVTHLADFAEEVAEVVLKAAEKAKEEQR